MLNRNSVYTEWIAKGIENLKSFQDLCNQHSMKGCFFYPAIKENANYINARWQEAVLAIAYNIKYAKDQDIFRVVEGIDYWCTIQHKNGSFEEYCKGENSFSATAFSLYAVAESAYIIGMNDRWEEPFKRAADWLLKNNETILINQEAAAALALLRIYFLTKDKKYLDGAQEKLNIVLKNQTKEGYYLEKKGMDLGYSSLTVDLLSRYYSLKQDSRILDSVNLFFSNYIKENNWINSRNTDWIVISGFEHFSHKLPVAAEALKRFLEKRNIIHLPDDRHLCTDLYRTYWALININDTVKNEKIIAFKQEPIYQSIGKYALLRKIGMHKLRRLAYLLK